MASKNYRGILKFNNVILKSINPFVNKEGKVNQDILVVTFENPTTNSLAEIKFFTKNWDDIVVFNDGKTEKYKPSSATDEIKSKCLKYTIVGKNTNEYVNQKDFCEALKKCIGTRVSAEGTVEYSVNEQGYLQTMLSLRKIILVKKEEVSKIDSSLELGITALFSKHTLANLSMNNPIDMYIPVKGEQYFKVKTMIPYNRFLGGVIDDMSFGNYVLEQIYEERKYKLEGNSEYYEINLVIELEQGAGERKATVEDLPAGYTIILRKQAGDDEEKYKELLQKKLDELPVITEEKGTYKITYLYTKNDITPIPNPSFVGRNEMNKPSSLSIQDVLAKAKEKQNSEMAKQANVTSVKVEPQPNTETVVDNNNEVTNESEDSEDFPF